MCTAGIMSNGGGGPLANGAMGLVSAITAKNRGGASQAVAGPGQSWRGLAIQAAAAGQPGLGGLATGKSLLGS